MTDRSDGLLDLSTTSVFDDRKELDYKPDVTALSLSEASSMIRQGSVTPTQLTGAILRRIAAYDGKLNAYISINGEDALALARELDMEQTRGNFRGPLHGIPIALKDNIDTAGVPTTAASGVYRDRIPREDAEVTRRLKAAGAIVVGKLNLHEFAAGGTGHVSAFGAAHNPWALDRVTGGSSSGSGGAVAARLCFGALGTDTLRPSIGIASIVFSSTALPTAALVVFSTSTAPASTSMVVLLEERRIDTLSVAGCDTSNWMTEASVENPELSIVTVYVAGGTCWNW